MTESADQKGKITLGLIASWGLGAMFLLAGVACIADPSASGAIVPFLLIAVLLLPPIRSFVYQKTGKSLSTGVRIVCILILMGFAGAGLTQTSVTASYDSQSSASAAAPQAQPENSQVVETKETSQIPDQVKNSIMNRCQTDNGEFGATLVKACVDQDIKAYKAIQAYPAEYAPLIERCKMDNGEYGWLLVKACIDQDIKSQKALDDY